MLTEQEAFDATNPDPGAYGLPSDAPEDEVNKRRVQAAQNLLAGVTANEVYWNSRTPLEALAAKAQGHASIGVPPQEAGQDATVVQGDATTTIDTTATTTTAPDAPALAPAPDNPEAAIATLRQQLSDAGINPEA